MSDHTTTDAPADPGRGSGLSRRHFLGVNATVLATVALAAATPSAARAAGLGKPALRGEDLAAYRPVSVSSTALAPAAPEFAVDGLSDVGVKGTGWRAEDGADQWIAVDLQGLCSVTGVRVTFEAQRGDPAFEPAPGDNPRNGTTGWEILSSYATAFVIQTSRDGRSWSTARSVTGSSGGVVDVVLDEPVTARWVRLRSSALSTTNPLGVNGFAVYGSAPASRPRATGWTDWPTDRRPAPALRVADDGTVPVESGWRLTFDERVGDADGATLSSRGVDTSGWLPATVPGTVLATLVERGLLPDPVFGLDNLHVPEALSRQAWWYRRELTLPHGLDTGAGRHIWLELDGVNHEAELWLNGTRLGTLSHPFARASYDVTDVLEAHGSQVLAARLSPMPQPGSPGDKGPDGSAYTDAGSDLVNQASPTWLSVTGWDWMPAVRDRATGIWNHVRLRSTGALVVGDLRIDTTLPDLPDLSVAELAITVPLTNADDVARTARVRVAPLPGVSATRTVTVPARGSVDVTFTPASDAALRVRDPELWWPNGYGDPALHDLVVTVTDRGEVSDTRTVRYGIRQLDYAYGAPLAPPAGSDRVAQTVDVGSATARYVRIYADSRASMWGVSMWTLSVLDAAGTDLARGRPVVASSVDQPGHEAPNAVDGDPSTRWSSNYTDGQWIRVDLGSAATFAQVAIVWETGLAARFRIQTSPDGDTWTDVKSVDNGATPLQISVNGTKVLCRGGNWGWDELLRRGLDGRLEAMVRMHRHMNFTMIRVWLGTSNREELYRLCDENGILVWNDFPLAWFLDPPDHALFLAQSRDTVLRYRTHPCLAVWCGANEGTPPAEVDQGLRAAVGELTSLLYQSNSREGIVSGGGAYWHVSPDQYYTGGGTWNSFGFHTEVGIPTVSVAASMRNLVGEGQEWPPGDAWFLHDWATKGAAGVSGYREVIEKQLGDAADLDDFCTKAQLVNYEGMRAMFEAWNARLFEPASGLLLWMSNPAWHSTVWQTYDYDLDVNGSYYGARKGCEPLHVQADATDWTLRVTNHTTTALRGARVRAEVLGLDGRALAAPVTEDVTVGPSATRALSKVPFGDSLPAAHLLRLRLTDAHDALVSENVYWRYRADEDLRALGSLGRARLTARASWRRSSGKGEVTVRNVGSTVAAMVRVSLRDRVSGERVLPVLASDNYVWLLPGESRTLTLEDAGWVRHEPPVDVVVEGYNVETFTTRPAL